MSVCVRVLFVCALPKNRQNKTEVKGMNQKDSDVEMYGYEDMAVVTASLCFTYNHEIAPVTKISFLNYKVTKPTCNTCKE